MAEAPSVSVIREAIRPEVQAFHGGNGGVGCNELFDDGINGVWVHSENYLQS